MSLNIRRAIQAMCKSFPGGYLTAAAALGMSESGLENRIYERKGQTFTTHDALQLQASSGRTDFAEAVATDSGGIFLRLPARAAMDEEDIKTLFMTLSHACGQFNHHWLESTDDGELTDIEQKKLKADYQAICRAAAAVIHMTDKYYRHHTGGNDD